ncbi:MAG: protein phosphatase 2C domain-containing protein [Gammaproteobacteria bacterium]|jgi:serine/threonine protein phosphatase PrpC
MKYDVSKSNRLGNRKSNQDRIGVVETSEAVLLVLADGLGGHAGGDVAAETVVDCAFRYFNNVNKPIRNPGAFLSEVILRTHREIITLAASCDPPLKAKSTCVLCIVQDGFAHWAHVGDSRLYVVRNNKVFKRTRDHSKVEELYQRGVISQQEKQSHPEKNLLTRCIGSESHRPQAQLAPAFPLQQGDVILLCSDGLWSPLSDRDIVKGVNRQSLNDAIEDLSSDAEEASYPNSDNISVIGFRWQGAFDPIEKPKAPAQQQATANEDIDTVNQELEDMINQLNKAANK